MTDTIDIVLFGALCFALGFIGCGWWAFQLWIDAKSAPTNANLVIDPALLHKIDAATVQVWLDLRGLTWIAKGADFELGKGVKK